MYKADDQNAWVELEQKDTCNLYKNVLLRTYATHTFYSQFMSRARKYTASLLAAHFGFSATNVLHIIQNSSKRTGVYFAWVELEWKIGIAHCLKHGVFENSRLIETMRWDGKYKLQYSVSRARNAKRTTAECCTTSLKWIGSRTILYICAYILLRCKITTENLERFRFEVRRR